LQARIYCKLLNGFQQNNEEERFAGYRVFELLQNYNEDYRAPGHNVTERLCKSL